jgi:hypothetical protein
LQARQQENGVRINPEDQGITFLWNAGIHLHGYKMSQPRRLQSGLIHVSVGKYMYYPLITVDLLI